MKSEDCKDCLRNNYVGLDKNVIKKEANKDNLQENPFEKNDFIKNEKLLLDYPMPISLKQTEKIIDQLKNNICNIYLGSKGRGTGFFMKIKFPDHEHEHEHLLPVLVTCNHLIDKSFLSEKDKIDIEINGKLKSIELKDRIKYTNKEKDITIIEINEKKDEIKNFLQLDEENQNIRNSGNTIYILEYFNANGPCHPSVPSVSFGILKDLDNLSFKHCCNINFGSSGSPILNLSNNKVIGIHKGAITIYNDNYNIGRFLNNPINDFIKKINNNKIEENEIKSLLNNETKKLHVEDAGISKDNKDTDNKEEESNFSYEKNLNIIDETKFMDELTNNNISNINILEKIKFEKLEKLYLDNNKISDISILEKVRYKELKELCLNGNNITNIEILEKVNFPKIEALDLSCNKIINVDIFEKVHFIKLKTLCLYRNKISNIDKIKLAKFENLELFTVSHNERIDINSLKDFKFENLKFLFLADIVLEKTDIIGSFNFKHLKLLTLGGNNISNIKVLSKVDFQELEILIFYDNKISDIEVLADVNFPNIKFSK